MVRCLLLILEAAALLQVCAKCMGFRQISSTNYCLNFAEIGREKRAITSTLLSVSVSCRNVSEVCEALLFDHQCCSNNTTDGKPRYHRWTCRVCHRKFSLPSAHYDCSEVSKRLTEPCNFVKLSRIRKLCQYGNLYLCSKFHLYSLVLKPQVQNISFQLFCDAQTVNSKSPKSFLVLCPKTSLGYPSATKLTFTKFRLSGQCPNFVTMGICYVHHLCNFSQSVVQLNAEQLENIHNYEKLDLVNKAWPSSRVEETLFKQRDLADAKQEPQTETDSLTSYQRETGQYISAAPQSTDWFHWEKKPRFFKKESETSNQRVEGKETSSAGPKRAKRNASSGVATLSCTLHLVADYLFFKHSGEGDVSKTVSLMKRTVLGADAIFRTADFNLDGLGDNIGFLIKNITVLNYNSKSFYSYSLDSSDYMGYLQNFSRVNFSDYCLGIAFTYRKFDHNVGGVAWLASSSAEGNPGGICQSAVYVKKYQAFFSFNTVVISFFSPLTTMAPQTAVLALAHEIGHSFGSNHDKLTSTNCRFGESGGNYLMNLYSTIGELPNNYKFSPCSLRLMYPVIVKKGTCLLRYIGNHCGNGVKEEGEECDCGTSGTCDFNDPCCTPADVPQESADKPCMVRRSGGKICSPSSSICCTNDCQILTDPTKKVCRESTECHAQSVCDGVAPDCPEPVKSPNGSSCWGETRFCLAGLCAGSICKKHGFFDCLCTAEADDLCKLCCSETETSTCLPGDVLGIQSAKNTTIFLRAGEPCWINQAGYCDNHHFCLPYLDFAGMIFAAESEGSFKQWIVNYGLYVIAGLVFFVLFIFMCMTESTSYLQNAHAMAFQYGRIIAITGVCEFVQLRLASTLATSKSLLDNLMIKIENGNCPEMFVEAITRLRTLFPTAPLSHLISAALTSTSEDVAVRILLAKGYPMRRFLSGDYLSPFLPGRGPEDGPQGDQSEENQHMMESSGSSTQVLPHPPDRENLRDIENNIHKHDSKRAQSSKMDCLEKELALNRHFLIQHFSQSHPQVSDSVKVIQSTDMLYMNLVANADNIDYAAGASKDADSDHGSSIGAISVDREPTDFSITVPPSNMKFATWLAMSLNDVININMSPGSGQEPSSGKALWFRWLWKKVLHLFKQQEISEYVVRSGLMEGESSLTDINEKMATVPTAEVAIQTECRQNRDGKFSPPEVPHDSFALMHDQLDMENAAEQSVYLPLSLWVGKSSKPDVPHSDKINHPNVPSSSAVEYPDFNSPAEVPQMVHFRQDQMKESWKSFIPLAKSKTMNVQKKFISPSIRTYVSEPLTSLPAEKLTISKSVNDHKNTQSESEAVIDLGDITLQKAMERATE